MNTEYLMNILLKLPQLSEYLENTLLNLIKSISYYYLNSYLYLTKIAMIIRLF